MPGSSKFWTGSGSTTVLVHLSAEAVDSLEVRTHAYVLPRETLKAASTHPVYQRVVASECQVPCCELSREGYKTEVSRAANTDPARDVMHEAVREGAALKQPHRFQPDSQP